nr:acylamino-acid-releasing enzyme [Tanacetum cinerariifolium]
VECVQFPNEVTGASLSMPSLSGSKLLAVRNPENGLATHLKILDPFQLEKEIRVPQSMHGSMHEDGW